MQGKFVLPASIKQIYSICNQAAVECNIFPVYDMHTVTLMEYKQA